jgi:hypothetical protein
LYYYYYYYFLIELVQTGTESKTASDTTRALLSAALMQSHEAVSG